jgi:hypothetical protein
MVSGVLTLGPISRFIFLRFIGICSTSTVKVRPMRIYQESLTEPVAHFLPSRTLQCNLELMLVVPCLHSVRASSMASD